MTGEKKDDIGTSVSYCLLYLGIFLAVLGAVVAVLAHFRVQDPFWIGAIVMIFAVLGYYMLFAFWFLARAFRTLNVLLLAVCAALAIFFAVKSIILPLVYGPPDVTVLTTLRDGIIHSPVAIFLAATALFAAALLRPAKRPA
jgi:hypothetical protein